MSRTYRKDRWRQYFTDPTRKYVTHFNTKDIPWDEVEKASLWHQWYRGSSYEVTFKKDSKTGKKMLARYRSDAGTHNFKEPGPHWFRNLFSDRPLRRYAKNELRKVVLDDEYEVIIEEMPKLPYWT